LSNALGKELGAIVVPVGAAWQKYCATRKTPPLYATDQSHPSLAGSYLAACVFLAVLFRQNPTGIKPAFLGLTDTNATALQRAAWKAASAK
jgi:hypothetical protein